MRQLVGVLGSPETPFVQCIPATRSTETSFGIHTPRLIEQIPLKFKSLLLGEALQVAGIVQQGDGEGAILLYIKDVHRAGVLLQPPEVLVA